MSNPTTSITITNTQPTMDLEEDATTGMTPTKPEDSSIPPVPGKAGQHFHSKFYDCST